MDKRKLENYPDIMTAANISEYLHISRRRVYELLNLDPENGGIPCIVIGITKRVRKDSFIEWLNHRESKSV